MQHFLRWPADTSDNALEAIEALVEARTRNLQVSLYSFHKPYVTCILINV